MCSLRVIDGFEVDYIKAQLESSDGSKVKRTLQDLCKLYRNGARVQPTQLPPIINTLMGFLQTHSDDRKIVRWALNAIAQFGTSKQCRAGVLYSLQAHADDPACLASGIAAAFKVCQNPIEDLRHLQFDQSMLTLAALQHVKPGNLDLSSLPLNIDKASPELLKLGLIIVGLNKTVPRLFNPSYSNQKMVRVLGGHDDKVVSQYSIWAITENSNLSVRV